MKRGSEGNGVLGSQVHIAMALTGRTPSTVRRACWRGNASLAVERVRDSSVVPWFLHECSLNE
eukprot:573648-Alexandrium_andersonii.AAC.1